MVLELFLKHDVRKLHPLLTVFVGFLYALLGGILAYLFFQPYMSITMVFITVLACSPFMYKLISKEEKRELEFHTERQFFKDYLIILKSLLFLFAGFVIGYLAIFLALSNVSDTATVHITEYSSDAQTYSLASSLGEHEKTRQMGSYLIHQRENGWWWQSADVLIYVDAKNELLAHAYTAQYSPDSFQKPSITFIERDQGEYKFVDVKRTKYGSVATYQKGPQAFAAQLQVLPDSIIDSPKQFWKFDHILINNVGIVAICLLFSFLFGAGAIFIITWNASLFSAAIARLVVETFSIATSFSTAVFVFLQFLSSGVFEIAAYFLAGLAGSIISFGIANHEVGTKKFLKTASDAFQLVFISLALLVIAAAIEVFIVPVFF